MTSVGTLVAFLVVSIGVMVLRRRQPDLPRGFKVPGYPVTPILADPRLPVDHQGPAAVTLLVFVDLDRRRAGLVLHLRPQALPPRAARARRASSSDRRRPRRRDRAPCMRSTRPPNRWCAACSRTPRTGCGWIRCRWTRAPIRPPISTTCWTGSSGTRGRSPDEVLGVYSSVIAPSIISADSPRFLGFIPAAPTKASLLFDMLVSCASIQGISWLEASGAIAAENTVLRLIADEAGHAGRRGRLLRLRRLRRQPVGARGGPGDRQEAAGRRRPPVGGSGSSSAPTRTPRS